MSPHKYEAALHVMKKWRVDIEKRGDIYKARAVKVQRCSWVYASFLVLRGSKVYL